MPFAYLQVPPYTARDPKEVSRIAATLAAPEKHHSALDTLSHLLPTMPPAIEHMAYPDHGVVHPVPITDEAFAPFGHLIKAHPDPATRPGSIETQGSLVTGKAEKYVRLAPIISTYPRAKGLSQLLASTAPRKSSVSSAERCSTYGLWSVTRSPLRRSSPWARAR